MKLNREISFKKQTLLIILLIMSCVFLSTCGKKTQKVYRVGIISGAEAFVDIADGFKARMTELGYIEDENIVYYFARLNADPAEEKRAAENFVSEQVDLIFAFPTEPALMAKTAAQDTNIPVVFALGGIEGSGLVNSISEPGGNITGVRFPGPEITDKRLEILQELVPNAKRIYLIYDATYPNAPTALDSLNKTSAQLGMTLVKDPVKNIREIQAALQKRAAMDDIGVDAIFIMPEILTQSPEAFELIITFANEHKIPVSGGVPYTVEHGALFSLSAHNSEMGKLSASLVAKIFKGTPAGTIMVITPGLNFWLNYKVAMKMGLNISEGLLSRADVIIR
ncbi:MAG: ABC transporter substrate-binding protein [Phycisphaerae bacterium]|jgi:putative ABC transport system substrate-binding protein